MQHENLPGLYSTLCHSLFHRQCKWKRTSWARHCIPTLLKLGRFIEARKRITSGNLPERAAPGKAYLRLHFMTSRPAARGKAILLFKPRNAGEEVRLYWKLRHTLIDRLRRYQHKNIHLAVLDIMQREA